MKTSLNETIEIEHYLLGNKSPEDALLFQVTCILQPKLAEDTAWQKRAYELIRHYSQKKLRQEIEAVHEQIFHGTQHVTFRRRIASFFLKR